MSSDCNNMPIRVVRLVPFPGFTGCSDEHGSGQSGPPFRPLRQLIENELVGVPLQAQKDTLNALLHLLGKADTAIKNKL